MAKWQGAKAGGTHTTVIEAALPLIKVAEKMDAVKKIVPGYIQPTPGRTGERRVRFKPISGGIRITVRGNVAIQEIYIYTDSPKEVQEHLAQVRL